MNVDSDTSELAENAPVQEPAPKKRKRRILIFCVVSLINVGLLVLLVTQLLTPAQHASSDPLYRPCRAEFFPASAESANRQGYAFTGEF